MKGMFKFLRCHAGIHSPAAKIDPRKSRVWWCCDCGTLIRNRSGPYGSAAVSMICSDLSQMNRTAAAACTGSATVPS